jgi:hypothetical protein
VVVDEQASGLEEMFGGRCLIVDHHPMYAPVPSLQARPARLVELMADRLSLAHTTITRGVKRLTPWFVKHVKAVNEQIGQDSVLCRFFEQASQRAPASAAYAAFNSFAFPVHRTVGFDDTVEEDQIEISRDIE